MLRSMRKRRFSGWWGAVALAGLLGTWPTGGMAGTEVAMKITPETLAELATQYRAEGLPLPPPGVKPTLIETGETTTHREAGAPTNVLGFPLQPGTFLVGTETVTGMNENPPGAPSDTVEPDRPLTAPLADAAAVAKWFRVDGYPVNRWLAVAVQCESQGFHELARTLFERGLTHDQGAPEWVQFVTDNRWPDPSALRAMNEQAQAGDGGDPHIALAATAWNHWFNFVNRSGTDRREALRHLEGLATEFPGLAGAAQKEFLEALRLTVQPGKGAPGSPEALIDGLTELWGGEKDTFFKMRENQPDYVQLSQMGFAAVPVLIAHMDDPRLTRLQRMAPADLPFMREFLKKQGYGRIDPGPETLTRVGDMITPLVHGLMGPTGVRRGLLKEGLSRQDLKAQAEQWWAEASKQGEEDYVVGRVLPIEGVQRGINDDYLEIVGAKYPGRLGGIYAEQLKQPPQAGDEAIVKAIVKNPSLAQEEKVKPLHAGAEHPDLARREQAITGLLALDPTDGETRLIRELDRLPTTLDRPASSSPVVQIGILVRRANQPAAWEAYERAIQRADVALRIELLNGVSMGSGEVNVPECTQARIKLLADFLDDETVRVMPAPTAKPMPGRFRQDAPTGLFDYPQFTVRDYVASRLPNLVGLSYPQENFDEAGWTRWRQTVRTAIKNRAEAQRKGFYPPDKD